MNKKAKPTVIDDDGQVWTEENSARSKPFSKLPKSLQAKLAARKPRGPQKSPTKVSTTIRLSSEVIESFRSTGTGWQTRINSVLKDWLKKHPAA